MAHPIAAHPLSVWQTSGDLSLSHDLPATASFSLCSPPVWPAVSLCWRTTLCLRYLIPEAGGSLPTEALPNLGDTVTNCVTRTGALAGLTHHIEPYNWYYWTVLSFYLHPNSSNVIIFLWQGGCTISYVHKLPWLISIPFHAKLLKYRIEYTQWIVQRWGRAGQCTAMCLFCNEPLIVLSDSSVL